MTELRVYSSEEVLYDRIKSGKEKRYSLTTRIPQGIPVRLGEERISRGFFYRENRPIVCLGELSNCQYLIAIDSKKVTDLGGRLN